MPGDNLCAAPVWRRHSEKSVQQNGDADGDMGMVFAARTGPPGSTVHFWEYSAGQDGCIRAGHPLLAPKTPSTGDLGRQTDFVETNKHVSRRTGPQNDVDLRNVSQLQRYRRNLPCRILRFLHGPGGGTSGPERTPQLFYAICNWKYAKHQEKALLISQLSARGSSVPTLRSNPAEWGRS